MMKKTLILLLLCCVLCAPSASFAAPEEFEFDKSTGTLLRYLGASAELTVPDEIGGARVKAIGMGAFDQNTSLRSVVLPDTVTHLMGNAFYFCENLASIRLPAGLQAVDSYAFFGCSALQEVAFPAGLAYLGRNAFASCANLTQIAFPGEMPMIGDGAFDNGPDNRAFTVPDDGLAAYEAALGQPCQPGGASVYVDRGVDASLLDVDPQSGEITAYRGEAAYAVLPDEVDGKPVTGIAPRAFFANPWLRRIRLPEGTASVGDSAFFGTRLAEAVLPSALKTIGQDAFSGSPLERLLLPDGLETLGQGAFANGAFKEVHLPEGLREIPKEAFLRCWSLETAYFPETLEKIGEGAFLDCDKMSYLVFAGSAPPEIAPDAFKECDAIADIDIASGADKSAAEAFRVAFEEAGLTPGGFAVWRADPPGLPPYDSAAKTSFDEATGYITSYESAQTDVAMFWSHWNAAGTETMRVRGLADGVFENAALTSFFVPHSGAFESIGARAFAGSTLERIHLFDSVRQIGDEAFAGCQNLREITLPDGVSLGRDVFSGCASLEKVVLPADAVLSGSLGLPPEKLFISVDATPAQRAAMQQALDFPWYLTLPREGEALAFTPMPDSFAPSAEADFEFDAQTGTLRRYIGQEVTVVVPKAIGGVPVRAVGETCFSNLTVLSVLQGTEDNVSLTRVVLPETVTSIGDSAFLNCTALTSVECYGPLERVGIRAFEMCESLTEVVFHNGVREMGVYTFNQCKSLHTAKLGSALAALPEGAFFGCGFTGELVLNTPEIGDLAYSGCAGVTSVHVLPAVKSLGAGAFNGMPALREAYFEGGDAAVLGEYRFQFDKEASALRVCLPEGTSGAQQEAFVTKMNQNLLPGGEVVILKDCPDGHPLL